MQVTQFGLLIGAVGFFLLLYGRVPAMLWLIMICSMLGGSAALFLPALGGASVPPAQFALLLGVTRIILPGSGQLKAANAALRANVFLGLYTAYGVATAFIASRLFAGTMQVVALRYAVASSLFATTPLEFSSQNITTAMYMVCTFLMAIVTYVALRDKSQAIRFTKVAVIIASCHALFGIAGVAFRGTPYDQFVAFMRNAHYAQNDQVFNGIVRINGIWPEASSYAGFGFDWFVFLFECWFRNVLPRLTGPAAAIMVLVLFFSTSSTAYGALSLYAAIILARILLLPQSIPARKGLMIAGAVLVVVIAVSGVFFIFPKFATQFSNLIHHLTVEKQTSESGLQRAFWAKVGLTAFVQSSGLGVGPGSFRSSTLSTAMIGSVGIIGTLMFVAHFINIFKPLRRSTYYGTYRVQFDVAARIGAAASWGCVAALIQGFLIAPTCDLGGDFAIFGGAALALRRLTIKKSDDKLPTNGLESEESASSAVKLAYVKQGISE